MLTGANGTIKIGDNDKVVFEIAQNDLEKFREYERSIDSNKFYADFLLDDKKLYVTGFLAKTEENQKDTAETMLIASANTKVSTVSADIKALFGLDNGKKEVEVKVQALKHPRKQLEKLKSKTKELETQLKEAEQEKQNLEAEIKTLNAKIEKQKQQVDTLAEEKAKVEELENAKKEVEKDKAELEAKNKTTEQPKQSNGAKYTATVGMGLAAGLIAFTALERTVRLEMLVMIGIAVTSALVVGGIT